MFSIEVRINSQLVGHIYCHNEGNVGQPDIHEYRYTYYEPESAKIKQGQVYHSRKNGIMKLAEMILIDSNKEA